MKIKNISKILAMTCYLSLQLSFGQNLLPNPSFETTYPTYCSSTYGTAGMMGYFQICSGWYNAANMGTSGSSVDHNCNYNLTPGILMDQLGSARTGSYVTGMAGTGYPSTEGMFANLSTPINAGTSVTVSFYAKKSSSYYPGTTDVNCRFGVYFFNTGNVANNGWVLSSTPHFSFNTSAINYSTWTLCTATFIVPVYATKMAVGFFLPTGSPNPTTDRYFAIDDISLTVADPCVLNPLSANAGLDKSTSCTTPTAVINGSASGGTIPYTYSWNNGAGTTQNPTVNPSTTTTYTLTVTDGNGCTATDQVVVNADKSPPIANAGTDKTTTCTAPSAVLNGSASGGTSPFSYSWNNGAGTTQNPTVNPASNTTYTLTVTGANGCSATDQVDVIVDKANPTANAGLDKTTTCSASTAVLDGSATGGSAPYSYAWNNGAGAVQSPTVNPATTTTYTLTVTGANGCINTDQATVTVNESLPTANAGADFITNCNTPTATLSGSASGGVPPYTYAWNNGAGSSASPTVNPAATTTYTLTVTGANGCTNTDQATVTVDKTPPAASAGADINLNCVATSGTFTASGGGTYSWSTPSGIVAGSTVSVTDASTTGNFTVTVTGTNGCTATDVAILTIDQTLPIANAGADQISNCATPTVTLDGSASSGTGITFAWSGPNITSGGSTSTATADTPGSYTLTVTGGNGCTDTDQVTVNPDNNYPIADAGADQVIDCNNSSVTLDGSGSDTGANISYIWSTSNGNITGSTSSNITTSDLDGSYSLTVTNSSNGCSSTDAVLVTQDTVTPIVSLSNGTYVIDCNNPTATFDASLSSGVGNTYTWTTFNGNFVSGATSATPTVDLDGTYNLIITAANGCNNLSPASVVVSIDTVSPIIDIQIPDTLTCLITFITLDASASQTGVTYYWSTLNGNILAGATSANPTVDSIGNYLLTITSGNGCSSSLLTNVVSSTDVSTQIIADPSIGEVPLDVNFTQNSTGNGLTYLWDFGTGQTDSLGATSYTYTDIGTYHVYLTVTDIYGCVAMDSITIDAKEVSEVVIPNIFTPNGDGNNDIFKVTASSVKNLTAQIINRWGQVVYEWDTPDGGWDGHSSSGTTSSSGTYYYFISVEFFDGRVEEHKGPLMLQK
jgi:gliding motility-associated-like protein